MYNTNAMIFHSLSLHGELIIIVALADATYINHLTRPGYVETGFLMGFNLLGKDMLVPRIQFLNLTPFPISKGQPAIC
jgi:hypothetical protein